MTSLSFFTSEILFLFFFQSILDALNSATQGRTSICIAHRLSTIMDADEILVLDKGKLAERGSHNGLISNPNSLYSRMWTIQYSAANNKSEQETKAG